MRSIVANTLVKISSSVMPFEDAGSDADEDDDGDDDDDDDDSDVAAALMLAAAAAASATISARHGSVASGLWW